LLTIVSIESISFKYLTVLNPVAANASKILIFLNSLPFTALSSFIIFEYSLITAILMSLLNSYTGL
jgi:hypothetical protein